MNGERESVRQHPHSASAGPSPRRAGANGCDAVPFPLARQSSAASPSRAADAARGPGGTVVESFGQVWLFAIGPQGLWPAAGEQVAEIGPLEVGRGRSYAARYMEAVFRLGMQTRVHTRPGPEAWYTLSGEMCLETPEGAMTGRAGGPPVIVPEGPPMQLTATGTEVRRALVLVLHDAPHPASVPAAHWQPRGLCRPSKWTSHSLTRAPHPPPADEGCVRTLRVRL